MQHLKGGAGGVDQREERGMVGEGVAVADACAVEQQCVCQVVVGCAACVSQAWHPHAHIDTKTRTYTHARTHTHAHTHTERVFHDPT